MSEVRKKINFTVMCVAEFAQHHEMTQKDAFQYLHQYRAIEFLKEFYDIEHTLPLDTILEDMFLICKNNGGELI